MFYDKRMGKERIILGIDPGLANTGWGVIEQRGSRLTCMAYGCVSTPSDMPLAQRLAKIHEQIGAVDALKKSWSMMKDHKAEMFWLGLSFIGWMILSMFTLGIGFLFLAPYMYTTFAHFYEDLKAEEEVI